MAERRPADDRPLVGDEVAAGEQLLDEPPHVPGADREDREDVALVFSEVARVARRATGGEERDPQQHDHRGANGTSAERARPPVASENQAANGTRNGRACGFVITANASTAAAGNERPRTASRNAISPNST